MQFSARQLSEGRFTSFNLHDVFRISVTSHNDIEQVFLNDPQWGPFFGGYLDYDWSSFSSHKPITVTRGYILPVNTVIHQELHTTFAHVRHLWVKKIQRYGTA